VIVLAAGRGGRLGLPTPKVLLRLGGRALLERHRSAFRRMGFARQIWVLGHRAAEVRAALGADRDTFEVVLNPQYVSSGSGYSLYLAACHAPPGSLVFMDADLLYDSRIFEDARGAGNRLLYTARERLDEEAVKVYAYNGRLHGLRKDTLTGHKPLGESVGIVALDAAGASALRDTLGDTVRRRGTAFEWEEAVETLAERIPIQLAPTSAPWIEIDFEEDLECAERLAAERIPPDRGAFDRGPFDRGLTSK